MKEVIELMTCPLPYQLTAVPVPLPRGHLIGSRQTHTWVCFGNQSHIRYTRSKKDIKEAKEDWVEMHCCPQEVVKNHIKIK